MNDPERYRVALLDWLACACGGWDEPATRSARAAGDGMLERVAALGCSGHVLDYDDTYTPGLVHASAAVAPAVLMLAAMREARVGAALDAFAAGFEATAALARAGHPALYERGWHPTSVCGPVGAATGAARLLGLADERVEAAAGLALLRAGGLRAAFGSQGKALQVGSASAAGLHAALLAQAGAEAPLEQIARGAGGFEQAYGGAWAAPAGSPAVRENWVKAYPCCLATHSPIEAALALRARPDDAPLTVAVHPVARQAAALDDVASALQAKFSIPYLVGFALLHGAPSVRDFERVDPDARALARERITVRLDPALGEMAARLETGDETLARVDAALGSPARPMGEAQLARKVRELAGERLTGALDDPEAPVGDVLRAAGLAPG